MKKRDGGWENNSQEETKLIKNKRVFRPHRWMTEQVCGPAFLYRCSGMISPCLKLFMENLLGAYQSPQNSSPSSLCASIGLNFTPFWGCCCCCLPRAPCNVQNTHVGMREELSKWCWMKVWTGGWTHACRHGCILTVPPKYPSSGGEKRRTTIWTNAKNSFRSANYGA